MMSQGTTLESLQKNVRKYIFEHFEEHAIAPVLEQIMRKFGLDRPSAFKVLFHLHSARHIALLTGTQRILMAFPFSSIVTLSESRWLERTKRCLRRRQTSFSLMVGLLSKIYNRSCSSCQAGEYCREEEYAGHDCGRCNRGGRDSVNPDSSSRGSHSTSFADRILGEHK